MSTLNNNIDTYTEISIGFDGRRLIWGDAYYLDGDRKNSTLEAMKYLVACGFTVHEARKYLYSLKKDYQTK